MKLLLFSSEKCSVCNALKPKLEKLAERFGVAFKEVKLEENPQECAQKMVFAAPTVILEENGKELNRWSGIFSLEEVENFLNRLLT